MLADSLNKALRNDYEPVFAANITLASTVTLLKAMATEPGVGTLHANEVGIVACRTNFMNVQVHSATGALIDVRAFGLRWCSASALWKPSALVQFRATMHGTGYDSSVLGDSLFPALSHAINLNNANAKALDGSTTYKLLGSLSFDTHGFDYIGFGLNPSTGTPKANIFAAGYN